MDLDDAHFMNIFKGKRIKLTLKSGSYSGIVQRINSNKTLILADVRTSDGCRLNGTKLFFGHEIVNVEFVPTGNGELGNLCTELQLDKKSQSWYDYDDANPHNEEDDFIDYVVIDEFHEKFGPAVMHIKKQPVIGVGVDGVECSKNGRLCWLQIATKKKVYLFDILLLGSRAFKNGLSMILNSEHILKVIHDCRVLAGCLTSQFGVNLTNVFDTQVADVMCFFSDTGGFLPSRVLSLHEAARIHLKVPLSHLSSLQMKSKLEEDKRDVWYMRPTPLPLLKMMALSVIHLQPLRLVLLDGLMTDYVALVDLYLNSNRYQPSELVDVNTNSVLELPPELKQLQQMRHERHEWAAGHYAVTEQGLLDRFTHQAHPPPKASPAVEDTSQTPTSPLQYESEKPLSPYQSNISVNHPPENFSKDTEVSSLEVPAPLNMSAQVSVQSSVLDLKSAGEEGEHQEVLIPGMGRGMTLRNQEQSRPIWPSIGRGFLFQTPPTREDRDNGRDGKLPLDPSPSSLQGNLPQPVLWDSYLPKGLGFLGKDLKPDPALARFENSRESMQ